MRLQRKRMILIGAAAISVLSCVVGIDWVHRSFISGRPHAHASGVRIEFATLRPNEQIIVKSLHGDRGLRVREYRFYWAAGERYADVLGNHDPMGDLKLLPLVRSRVLRESEAAGLDNMVRYFRRRAEEPASGMAQYELTYFRDHEQIGQELFIGYYLPNQLAYFAQRRMRNDPPDQTEYQQLAAESRTTWQELMEMFPFEYLELDAH
jgi:hypothetical protein